MQKVAESKAFKVRQNIVLDGFDPVSSGGFTQIPNCILNDKRLSLSAKVIYAKLLSYAWHNNRVFPGQGRMADEVGTTRQTVNKGISELQTYGYLDVKRRGLGLTNVYMLHQTVKRSLKK